jgi:hypothetical protein
VQSTLDNIREHDCDYVPGLNAIFALRLNMRRSAELVAHFVQRACQGLIGATLSGLGASASEHFYSQVLDGALIRLGSRVLYPSLAPVREADYYGLYSHPREVVESFALYSYRQYIEMIDFLLLHKDYELHRDQYGKTPPLIESGVQYGGQRFSYLTRELGLMLGTELYDAYVSNRITRQSLRSLFFRSRGTGDAAKIYFELMERIARPRRLMVA